MTADDWKTGDTIGFLFPDEMVEKLGLKEGDVFDAGDSGAGIVLRPVNSDLIERMRAAGAEQATYHVILQDLSKLA